MLPDPDIRPETGKTPLWAIVAFGALLGVALLGVYWSGLNAPFIFDDYPAVVRNATIRDLGHLNKVLNPPLDAAGATGRPLVNLTYAINYALHGQHVRGYHVGSVLLHAVGALLLFGFLRRTFELPTLQEKWPGSAAWRAGAITTLWAVHPLLTESVVCVAQRNEVLVGLFYFLTFYAFVRSLEEPAFHRSWQLLAVIACWLGMASKEVMATAPVLVLLFDRTFVAGSFGAALRERKRFYIAMFASWLLLAWLMDRTEQRAGVVGFGLGISAWDYLVTQGHAVALYLKLSLWPHPLVVDYGSVTFPLGDVWPQVLLVSALALATLWAIVRRPWIGFLGAWFFVILGPSSSFVPLTTQTIAEHRMYLPLAAVVIGVVLLLERLNRRLAPLAVSILVVGAAALTFLRAADYADVERLWTQTLRHQPDNARVHASLGTYFMQQRRWPEAIASYERAVTLRDTYADAHSDLGSLLLEVGRTAEALNHLRRAVELKPTDPVLHFNLGQALEKSGDPAGAMVEWETAMRLNPMESYRAKMEAAVRRRMGDKALQAGRAADAATHYARTVELEPADMEAWAGFGQALAAEKRYAEAVEKFRVALRIAPAVAELHYNLGNVWLEMERAEEAVAAFTEAVRLKPGFFQAEHNLALALVRAGKAMEAIPHYNRVLEAMPNSALVRFNLALALEQGGLKAEALEQALTVQGLDPRMGGVRELVERLRRR